MALLTDPNQEMGKIKLFFVKYQYILYFIMYFGSVVWFCLLAHDYFSAETYFSENALLPGLVQGEYEDEHAAVTSFKELKNERPQSVPYVWLRNKFRDLHMESYVQNFTINIPSSPSLNIAGKNVYGILRAPRSASTESLVLSVPFRSPNGSDPATLPGLALMLSLASFFRRQKYWAKDIIFLVTEHEHFGVQAWLESYHGTTCGSKGVITFDDLGARSGGIQAAINLEILSSIVSHIDVKLLGLNGQLPNLDLSNLVHRICSKEGIHHTFNNKDPQMSYKARRWSSKFKTMLTMTFNQAVGVPDGNHGLFHRFGIEALTLEGHPKSPPDSHTTHKGNLQSFHRMGRVLEGIFRSLNNLLEKFHQSYFFYLLPSSDRYVSIGYYMPCLASLVGIIFLKSFTLWVKIQQNAQDIREKIALKKASSLMKTSLNLFSSNVLLACSHIFGVFIMPIGDALFKLLPSPPSLDQYLFFFHFSIFLICLILFPVLVNRFCKPAEDWSILNILSLIEMGTFLLCASMNNFSFGYVLSLIYCIPSISINPRRNRFVTKATWVLIHPFLLLGWIVLLSTSYIHPELQLSELFVQSFSIMKETLYTNMVDYLVYGNWTYTVVITVLTSNWIAFWCLLNAPCTSDTGKEGKLKEKLS